jgi:hypothetical protein
VNPWYAEVAARAAHRCEYCRAPEAIFNFPFEIEHVVPVAKRGPTEEANLALACRPCNLFKRDSQHGIDPKSGESVSLFNPREASWDDHFTIDLEAGVIHGSTSTGRATVDRLRMNTPAQVQARIKWIQLRLFP